MYHYFFKNNVYFVDQRITKVLNEIIYLIMAEIFTLIKGRTKYKIKMEWFWKIL